ncbi:hypothetical protein HMPREF1212_00583 [Parabacteroides sp. HGS0025]|jgi:hypothetical protein|uniref:DNA alkylation repair protein n=1 Tax=Parabacteroides sp. HGS0025 TaxID=1078087 RepID=UPI0006172CB0|nr:DNA alkylation repair protein [Parabacteroides sp. HGS0025]KKB52432.1 hypothetical protein HMPREF1212_00583 [Parabacteroides sp. HGS0025]
MLQDELREIRTQLRMAMNGVISTSMREKGMIYKLNFGVPLPEVKLIAARHESGSELAVALWKEDIREFKLLAPLLQPVDDFPFEQAEQWVKEIPYLEIAEQCSRNLFCKLPYAEDLTLELIVNKKDEYARTVAFLIWCEMFRQGKDMTEPAKAAFLAESMRTVLRTDFGASWKEIQSAVKAMKFYGRQSPLHAGQILSGFEDFPELMTTAEKQEIYNELKFEFEYYS